MNNRYYIGVDAGGSKCRARLVDTEGSVLGHAETGPATIRRGADFAASSIIACIDGAVASSGLGAEITQNAAIAVGAAGTESSSETNLLLEKLNTAFGGGVTVISDARTACIGAHGGRDGGIVIVGTGSIGYGLAADKVFRVGGFGFPVSDLGSGAHIGLAAVQHALTFIESAQRQTDFAAAILAEVGCTSSQVAAWSEGAMATDYAGFAPLVVAHAKEGDQAANKILTIAAGHISDLVGAIRNQGAERISLMGGLSKIIFPLINPNIQACLTSPEGDAIDGAILLARGLEKQQT